MTFPPELACALLGICFTMEGENVAYLLACNRQLTLPLGSTYVVGILLVGHDLNEERRFKLAMRAWDDSSFEEMPLPKG